MGSPPQTGLNDTLARILAICHKRGSEPGLGALLALIAREPASFRECDRASIFLLARERQELWSKVAVGSDEPRGFDASRGMVGRAVTRGETVNVRDAYS